MGPDDLERLCPDWRERETFISGPNEMLDDFSGLYDREGVEERLHMERFQPKLGLGDGEEGDGRDDQVPQVRLRGRIRRQPADPRRRRGGRAGPALRLPRGDLPHLRRGAPLRPGPRPAQRQGRRRGGRSDPHLHPRPRGAGRDRAVSTAENRETRQRGGRMTTAVQNGSGPSAPAADEQLRESPAPAHPRADRGDRPRVRRAPRAGQGRPRRPRRDLHPVDDRLPAPAGADRPRRAGRLALAGAVGRSALPRSAWPRSSRTWRSATTSCTASGTG